MSTTVSSSSLDGAGLGLRRTHLGPLLDRIPEHIDFLELAPENWMGVGGRLHDALSRIRRERPIAAHGLTLNLGGPDPINLEFVDRVGRFLDEFDIAVYGDHLTYCAENGHLHELLPIPFTTESADYVAERIGAVQDRLGRRLAVENASYYCAPGQEIDEIAWLGRVLEKADCDLLLDVNNVYVNSINHGYDPVAFLRQVPTEHIAYAHIAGHAHEAPDLIVDTHGAPVSDPVWDLLDDAYAIHGVFPTLLERDENVPELAECVAEVEQVRSAQHAARIRGAHRAEPPPAHAAAGHG